MTAKLLLSLCAAALMTACTPYRPEVGMGMSGGYSGVSAGLSSPIGYRGSAPYGAAQMNPYSGPMNAGYMSGSSPQANHMQGGQMHAAMTHDALYEMNKKAVMHPEPNLQAIHQYNMARDHYAANPGLRSSYMKSQKGYAYGSLGGVVYDIGSGRSGLQGRIGYQTSKFYGGEIEGSWALGQDDETLTEDINGTIERDLGLKNSVAAFAVGRTEYTDKIDLLARVGYHSTQTRVGTYTGVAAPICVPTVTVPCPPIAAPTPTEPTNVDSRSQTGIAYGIGLEAQINRNGVIRGDLTAYGMENGTNKAFSLAYVRRF